MDPISHMKKQLRSLMEDIQEEELELAMKNPHLKVHLLSVFGIYIGIRI